MTTTANELVIKGQAAKAAARKMAFLSSEIKNRALLNIAEALTSHETSILTANKKDYEEGLASGMSEALLDRLLLNHNRLQGMANDIKAVVALPDPVGEIIDMRTLPNGLIIGRKRVPLGVIGTIYESRPNVTVDISVLCLKSGNAVILRGGKEATNSNDALAHTVQVAAYKAGVPEGAVQFIESTDRALVGQMLKMKDTIDLLIPRGGEGLIRFVRDNASMPVVAGGIGVCHTYVDSNADLAKAVAIVYNAKVQRPTVCNALDTVLVHRDIAERFLPRLAYELGKAGVEVHADERALSIFKRENAVKAIPAKPEDWGKEFLAL
ncbi:MAG: glutamate-5-semialdehyde dehydrogenase, partial [Dehalococcoidia bacterium]|nr:glutamate-5-semialdehyde dehydrogenase [Dehalococcoidia bacterium]